MIVIDESIQDNRIIRSIGDWYPGQVISIMDLRPATLLNKVKQPTFVTINVEDFWLKLRANQRYCIIALQLTQLQVKQETSVWLRKLLLLPEFRTKAARMGWIVYVRSSRIEYYTIDGQIRYLSWPT